MKYYIYYNSEGKVVGYNVTDSIVGASATEVSCEDFLAAGGDVSAFAAVSATMTAEEAVMDMMADMDYRLGLIELGARAKEVTL